MPLLIPKALAREVRPVNAASRGCRRGGINSAVPMPSRTELPRINTPSPGESAHQGAESVQQEAGGEAALASQRSLNLLAEISRRSP